MAKKKKKKKATRCSRKTKEGKRCKGTAQAGRKTCVSHGPKKKAKAAKKAKKRPPTKDRCQAKKADGKRCVRKSTAGAYTCGAHGSKKAARRASPGRSVEMWNNPAKRIRCQAKKSDGKRCKSKAPAGYQTCGVHGSLKLGRRASPRGSVQMWNNPPQNPCPKLPWPYKN